MVNVLLRKGCVMSPWLPTVYMAGVVPEVNARVLGNGRNCCMRSVSGLR